MKISTNWLAGLSRMLVLLAACGLILTNARAQTAPVWANVQRTSSSGTNGYSDGRGIVVGADGSQYVTGRFAGNLTLGTVTLSARSSWSLYLAKYSAAGTVLWANEYDSNGSSPPLGSLAVDAAGNVYMAGSFTRSVTFGTTTLTTANFTGDAYLVKYDTQGVLQWTRQSGGAGAGAGGIAVDASGNIIVLGGFTTSVSFGGIPLTGGGIFYYTFSPAGAVLQARRVASGACQPQTLTLDNAGNAYLIGSLDGTATFGTTTLANSSANSFDIFLCKLDAAGNPLWAVRDGAGGGARAFSVAVDAGGNPVICGIYNYNTGGPSQIYVARFTSQGVLAWTRLIASTSTVSGGNYANAVAYDGRGGYYVTGHFTGTVVFGTTSLTSVERQLFVVRYDSQGNAVWAGQATGASPAYAVGLSIAADAGGAIYLTGIVSGSIGFGAFSPVSSTVSGSSDTFVAKLAAGGVLSAVRPVPAALKLLVYPNPASNSITVRLPVSGGHLVLLDALGRTVRTQALPAAAGAYEVSLVGLAPGLYQLRATLGNAQRAHATLTVE